jgi:superfamily II DNA/RNA helicase
MLDMGFIPDIERICKLIPFTRQTLFFSATMPPEITKLTEQFLHAPVRIEVAKPASAAATVTQRLVKSGKKPWDKREVLRDLIRAEGDEIKNAIIFCNRKVEVSELFRSLVKHDFNAGASAWRHGPARAHDHAGNFRDGKLKLLVASDVAARGLDIPDVSHVFNYDVPIHAEDYVHRIGRTGRAGRSGKAFTIATRADTKYVDAIEKLIGQSIEWNDGDLSTVVESPEEDRPRRDRNAKGKRGERRERGKPKDKSAPQPIAKVDPVDDIESSRPAKAKESPARNDNAPRERAPRNEHSKPHEASAKPREVPHKALSARRRSE